jgi:hypothetical protein
MSCNLQYYLIHNLDTTRRQTMMNEFTKWGFDLNKITWMLHPNKDEITDELLHSLIIKEPSYSCGILIPPERTLGAKGLVCCTYKHYLALKDIVDNNYDYGVIIEDNICFKGKIPELIDIYIKQLNENYGEWDVLFDGDWGTYQEGPTNSNLLVYPKSNKIAWDCHGSTKSAAFYLIKKECAKKLIEHYIPFNNSPDWWMNDLFRKLNVKSFWVEPRQVYVHPGHISTVA